MRVSSLLVRLSLLSLLSCTFGQDVPAGGDDADCPAIFLENTHGLSTLYWSVLSRSLTRECHTCVQDNSAFLGLYSSSSSWSCMELLVAASDAPFGCSLPCLSQDINQCSMLNEALDPSAKLTTECQTCVDAQNCSSTSACQSACTTACAVQCKMPPSCVPEEHQPDPEHPCPKCMKAYHDSKWLSRECLISDTCRPFCTNACGNGLRSGSEQCDDGNLWSGDGCSATCTTEVGFTCQTPWSDKSTCSNICGDGLLLGKEECDDGNTNSDDGCDASCAIEPYWTCPPSTNGTPSVCSGVCGDHVVKDEEVCDDGNEVNGDGCSSNCEIEEGFLCTTHQGASSCSAVCGDGLIVNSETCDDGNQLNQDGCSSTCAIEFGYTCLTTPSVCLAICGNGYVEPTEVCDESSATPIGCSGCEQELGFTCTSVACSSICGDGLVVGNESCDDDNTLDNDGCSSTCLVERGYTCIGKTCSPTCGDGLVVSVEECDDANTQDHDGCSSTCTKERGWYCTQKNDGTHEECLVYCSDGIIVTPREACDDNNSNNGDGCSSRCQYEQGFHCTDGDAGTTCTAICGDGITTLAEACDDDNLVNGDGCSSTCMVEEGYTCYNGYCTPICGDGLLLSGEACDDMNRHNHDGCSAFCAVERGYECTEGVSGYSSCVKTCGDAVLASSETCDDGNESDHDGCSSTCELEYGYACTNASCTVVSTICGDREFAGTEDCDDGNTVNNDGCSSTCTQEEGYVCTHTNCRSVCGDGILVLGEQCDDGNTSNGDGCSRSCSLEATGNAKHAWNCPIPGSPCFKSCIAPRIRKSWDALTNDEEAAYLLALQRSIENGQFPIFVGMHFESRNEMQAHQTCAFLVWHRKYLLGFENMLRNQGEETICVTIPYWDYFADYSSFISGRCSTIEQCSSITRALGGSSGPYQSVNIPGANAPSGFCNAGYPVNSICPIAYSSAGTGSCSRCVPRGSWSSIRFPQGLGYGSIARLVRSTQGYASLSNGIQRGFHNTVHSALGGIMGSMASPADPIFFNHHNTIDMLYQIHHKCSFGRRLSPAEKQTNANAYESCGSTPSDGTPRSTSNIRMDVYSPGHGRLVPVAEHPVIGAYFRGMPMQFWSYVDTTDIGSFSYNYQVDELLTALIQNGLVCQNPNYLLMQDSGIFSKMSSASGSEETERTLMEKKKRKLRTANSASAYTEPAPALVYPADPAYPAPAPVDPAPAPVDPAPAPAPADAMPTYPSAPPLSAYYLNGANNEEYQWSEPVPASAPVVPEYGTYALPPAQQQYMDWFKETCDKAKKHLGAPYNGDTDQYDKIMLQAEYIECMQYERLYGCLDYTPEFKENFKVDYISRCKGIVDGIKDGSLEIVVPNWQQVCDQHFT